MGIPTFSVCQFRSEAVGLESGEWAVGCSADANAWQRVVAELDVAEAVAEGDVLDTEVIAAFHEVRSIVTVAHVPTLNQGCCAWVGVACASTVPAVFVLSTVEVVVRCCVAERALAVPEFATCLAVAADVEVESLPLEAEVEAVSHIRNVAAEALLVATVDCAVAVHVFILEVARHEFVSHCDWVGCTFFRSLVDANHLVAVV